MKDNRIAHLITKLDLPEQFERYCSLYFEPIAEIIDKLVCEHQTPPVVAINGSQGSGKSTVAIILKTLLETKYAHRIVIVSIDDFYHSKEKRQELSKSLHPLFITRGVPGTHDISLALKTIKQLKMISKGETVFIPRFDKATDDRKPERQWDRIEGPVSAIIFEGWCVGSPSLEQHSLEQAINDLERIEDKEGVWRKTSNQFLQEQYQALFKQINWLLMLKAPSFDVVYQWRFLQEQKLEKTLATEPLTTKSSLLDEQQLMRFIQHYQRLTEHNLSIIPELADAVITLNEHHQMTHLQFNDV
ncbi:MAG: phosphoribulokinase [gamma proteobacterium symbiont of Lucinoma myriamae]|nr:phosphoribulokinase [gamma proteobacterium symbiont of Lucinoma myriamae]MCU7833553.1 phosphoribulokinase [gamma proteobacterium symbiont of Lucinoma myriamae]